MPRGRKKKEPIESAFIAMGDNAAADFKGFCQRIDDIEEEMKGLRMQKKEIFNKAKENGYNTGPFKEVLKQRKLEDATRIAFTHEVDNMKKALGMLDLFEYAESKDAHASATEDEANELAA